METPSLPPLTPIALNLKSGTITLLSIQSLAYREAFFVSSIGKYTCEHPDAPFWVIPIEAFEIITQEEAGHDPDGFIFIMGRCGSTMLANMLSVPDTHLILKEPMILDELLFHWLITTDQQTRRQLSRLIRWLVPHLFIPTRGTERVFLIKCNTWHIQAAAMLLELFPQTPAIFLSREPEGVVASHLREPPPWRHTIGRQAPQALFFPEAMPANLSMLSEIAFYSYIWRSHALAALAQSADRLRIIDYQTLTRYPDATLRAVLDFFHLAVSPGLFAAMCRIRTFYAKGKNPQQTMAERQIARLSPEEAAQVLAIAGDLHQQLLARSWSIGMDTGT
jgi:hypothetical protein